MRNAVDMSRVLTLYVTLFWFVPLLADWHGVSEEDLAECGPALFTKTRCDSVGFQYHECPVLGANLVDAIKLFKNHSRSPCIVRESFGITDNETAIWVSKGCKAEFLVCFFGEYITTHNNKLPTRIITPPPPWTFPSSAVLITTGQPHDGGVLKGGSTETTDATLYAAVVAAVLVPLVIAIPLGICCYRRNKKKHTDKMKIKPISIEVTETGYEDCHSNPSFSDSSDKNVTPDTADAYSKTRTSNYEEIDSLSQASTASMTEVVKKHHDTSSTSVSTSADINLACTRRDHSNARFKSSKGAEIKYAIIKPTPAPKPLWLSGSSKPTSSNASDHEALVPPGNDKVQPGAKDRGHAYIPMDFTKYKHACMMQSSSENSSTKPNGMPKSTAYKICVPGAKPNSDDTRTENGNDFGSLYSKVRKPAPATTIEAKQVDGNIPIYEPVNTNKRATTLSKYYVTKGNVNVPSLGTIDIDGNTCNTSGTNQYV